MLKMGLEKLKSFFSSGLTRTGHLEKWISGFGGLAGMLAVIAISQKAVGADGAALVVASMGATAVLLFAVPHGPLSQPWPVIGGHSISAFIGVSCALWIPDTLISASAAVALAISSMHYLRCLHPPGGATALTAVVGGERFHALGFNYVFMPVFTSAVTIVIVAVLFNYLFSWRRYPASLANRNNGRPLADTQASTETNRLTRRDLETALKSLNRVVDISGHDLEDIYRLANNKAQSSGIDPADIQLGKYYSNGHYGRFWQIRQVIDLDSQMKSANDKVIYKVVAGKNCYTTDLSTRQDFANWARYEVFQNNDAWLRQEDSDYALEQA